MCFRQIHAPAITTTLQCCESSADDSYRQAYARDRSFWHGFLKCGQYPVTGKIEF